MWILNQVEDDGWAVEDDGWAVEDDSGAVKDDGWIAMSKRELVR